MFSAGNEIIMIEIFFALIFLVLLLCIKIFRSVKRQAAKEQAGVEAIRQCGCKTLCEIYTPAKILLGTIACSGIVFLIVSLVNGRTPTLSDLFNIGFLKTSGGTALLLLPQIAMYLLKRKFHLSSFLKK